MAVDPLFAQWLQADGTYVVRADAAAIARWASSAVTSERLTGIAAEADAVVEGDRQLAFFAKGPFGIETHSVAEVGWQDEIGKVVTFISDELGYSAGIDVFVIGADEDPTIGVSSVTVIRPLRGDQ